MKKYPTIPKKPKGKTTKFWLFPKIDGSNIRAEWSEKKGFNKFGSRKRLLGKDQGLLYKSKYLIEAFEEDFSSIFKINKIKKAVCFFEFSGPGSFAGNHLETDEHQVTLIDVDIYNKGLISPEVFLEMFEKTNIPIPPLLYMGPVDHELRNEIEAGDFPGSTFEGVVAKGSFSKRHSVPNMFKIKNKNWISKVKEKFDKSLWEQLL